MNTFRASLYSVHNDSSRGLEKPTRVLNPDIARKLAEAEKPTQDAKLAKWYTRGKVGKVVDNLFFHGDQEKARQKEIEDASGVVFEEISAEFEKQMDEILSILKGEVVVNGFDFHGDIPYKIISIGREKIYVSFLCGYQSISFGSPENPVIYKPTDPNALEILRIIRDFIEEYASIYKNELPLAEAA